MLIKRGLYATALENAKLLLGFNLADPTGVLMCIDYIAIKAGLYTYVQVCNCFTSSSRHTSINICQILKASLSLCAVTSQNHLLALACRQSVTGSDVKLAPASAGQLLTDAGPGSGAGVCV